MNWGQPRSQRVLPGVILLGASLGLLLGACSGRGSSEPGPEPGPEAGKEIPSLKTEAAVWSLIDHASEARGLAPGELAQGAEPRFDAERRLLAIPAGQAVELYLRLPLEARLELRLLRGEGKLAVELLCRGQEAPQRWTLEERQQELTLDLKAGGEIARLTLEALEGDVGIDDPRVVGERPAKPLAAADRPMGGAPSRRPNIIVYLVDTLRADRLGVYGSAAGLTPRLDAFAEGATVVERGMAASPWTRPSVASIFTGRWPFSHGVNTKNSALPDSLPTLAEILKSAGYRTAGFVANRQVSEVFGFDRGFDVYREVQGEDHYLADSSAAIHSAAVGWLDSGPSGSGLQEPFFLYLHALDPHAPYAPVEPWRSRFAAGVETPAVTQEADRKLRRLERRLGKKSPTAEHFAPVLGSVPWIMGLERGWLSPTEEMTTGLEALYQAEIAANDARFGELLDELDARGLANRTLVVFVTDHGEEFLDHGQWQHGKTFFDEVLRAAMVLRAPSGWAAPARVPAAGHPDLTATLLAAAGVPANEIPQAMEGRDLFGPRGSDVVPLFSWLDDDGRRGASVVDGDFKLVLWESPEVRQELFDLSQDPGETTSIADRELVLTGYLTSLLRGHRRRFPPPSGARDVKIDDETRRQLEALGYL